MGVLFARETENDSFTPVGMMGVGNASQSQRGLMTAQDKVKLDGIADYIVEQGTDGIWTYRKWNSGIAECWGIAHFTNVACTTAWGNIFQSSYFGNTAFPFEFTTVPTLTVHLSAMSTSDYSCWALVNGSNPTSESQTGAVIIARGSSATVPNVYINFHAIGTWK